MKQGSLSIEKIISAIALFAIGVCFIIWADKVTDWIVFAFGILALIAAAIQTIKFFKTDPSKRITADLLGIVLVAIVGVLFVSRIDFIKDAISFVVGIYIILSCSVQIMILSKLPHRGAIASHSYAWAIIGMLIGILCVIGKFVVPDALATITGVALIAYSIVYLIGLFTIQKAVRINETKSSKKKIAEATIVKEAKEAEVVKSSHSKKK